MPDMRKEMEDALDKRLLEYLTEGVPQTDRDDQVLLCSDCGEVIRVPPTAAVLNAARQRIDRMKEQDGAGEGVMGLVERARQKEKERNGDLPPITDEDDVATKGLP